MAEEQLKIVSDYHIECDDCGRVDDSNEATKEAALEGFKEDGWEMHDGTQLCPDCLEEDDDDEDE